MKRAAATYTEDRTGRLELCRVSLKTRSSSSPTLAAGAGFNFKLTLSVPSPTRVRTADLPVASPAQLDITIADF